VIDKRSADTVVVTPDAQTVIIGGMMQPKSRERKQDPIFGRHTVAGQSFQTQGQSGSNTELLIFLTPHIIQAPTEVAAVGSRAG